MNRILRVSGLCVLVCGCAFAQLPSSVFPGRIADQFDLGVATDFASGTLTSPINSSALVVAVTMDSGSACFQAGNFLTIGGTEKIKITSASCSSVTVDPAGRGLDGTTAASFLAGATIECDVNASYQLRLAGEIVGIETFINAFTGGSSSAFSAITSGTNTTAAMVCGTGCSIGTSGTGTNQATSLQAIGPFFEHGGTGGGPSTGIEPTLVSGQTGCWYSSVDSSLRCQDFAGDKWAMVSYTPPASSSAACTPPQVAVDTTGGFLDVCVSSNTWKRTTLSSF